MKIFICDDNKTITANVENFLDDMSIPDVEVEVFYSGDKLIEYIDQGERANIFLLDIEMEGSNGIEVGKHIRKYDEKSIIIYMTSHKDYVYDVFEVLPFRFLVKPLDEDLFKKAISESIKRIYDNNKFYFFKVERTTHQIPYDEILYFEGRGRKVCIHTKKGEYEFYKKISEVMEEIDDNIFLRVHNSYIVNMDFIRSVLQKELILENDIIVPVSKAYKNDVNTKHVKYMIWKSGV